MREQFYIAGWHGATQSEVAYSKVLIGPFPDRASRDFSVAQMNLFEDDELWFDVSSGPHIVDPYSLDGKVFHDKWALIEAIWGGA